MKTLMMALLGLASCASVSDMDVETFEEFASQPQVATLDVRTPAEYADGHLPWAANIDWQADDFLSAVEAAYPKETPLALYCRSGRRSAEAAGALVKAGYTVSNLVGGYLAWKEADKPTTLYAVETFFTASARPVDIALIKHGTLALRYAGRTLHVDPVGAYGKTTDYAVEFPKADYILVTHEHGDHYDPAALQALSEEGRTKVVTNARVSELLGASLLADVTVMGNGDVLESTGCTLEAVPAYNYTEGRTQFHPKGRDNGFVLTLDGLRIYIAGDTEDVPEMAALKDIDVAFLPVNQPYTMTVEQCVNAAKVIQPRVLIPYHFGRTDLSGLPSLLPGVDVRLREMQ